MNKMLLCLFLSVGSALADDYTLDKATGKAKPHYVGEIKSHRGEVFHVGPNKKKVAVIEGHQFYKSDSLVTGEKSIAKVLMVDETVITVGPNSELKFEEFEFTNKNDRRIHSFIRGQLTGHVKNKAKDGDIQFKTANAVMGVRGTEFAVNHRTVGDLEISEFSVLTGNVEVMDDKNQRYQLKKPDKIVLIRNNRGESMSDKTQLDPAEQKFLESEDKIYGPEYRPFMPFFDPLATGEKSTFYAFIHSKPLGKDVPSIPATGKPASEEGKKEGSFENLKKLNDELKKNKR